MKMSRSIFYGRFSGERGSQIAEFAIGLPFLMVLLFAIIDFGTAFNTKQKLIQGTREVARFASNSSTLDLSQDDPPSIEAAKGILASFLAGTHLDTCGLEGSVVAQRSDIETWTFTTQRNCPDKLTLKIERANVFAMSDGTNVISTKVTVVYPLHWHFGRIASVLYKGSDYGGSTISISAGSVMANLT